MKLTAIDKDILVVAAITVIAVALTFILPSNWIVGRVLTLPLVFLLPGYALMSALFPGREFGMVERLLFSLGLSLACVILGGLLLNLTPWGLRAGSWALLLGSITLGACMVTLLRRRRQGISPPGWLRPGRIGLNVRQGLLLGLAVLIVCGAVAVSIIGAERQPYPGFTQLWVLPVSGANSQNEVRLGVKNMESAAMEYRLVVNVDGRVVKVWPAIALNQNSTWQATLALPQSGHTGTAKVEANLYREDAPKTIYRHVLLWLST